MFIEEPVNFQNHKVMAEVARCLVLWLGQILISHPTGTGPIQPSKPLSNQAS
jgi:hypothetical protein